MRLRIKRIKDKVVGVNQSLRDAPCIRLQFLNFVEVIECICGLYNDLRGPADVSSQCFYPPRQVWYQFADPGGMEGLVSPGRGIEPPIDPV